MILPKTRLIHGKVGVNRVRPNNTIWGPRIWNLIAANNWMIPEAAKHLGTSRAALSQFMFRKTKKTIRKSREPRKATAKFVLALGKVEAFYQEELENYKWLKEAVWNIRTRENPKKGYGGELPDGWKAGQSIFPTYPILQRKVVALEAIERKFEERRIGLGKRREIANDPQRIIGLRFDAEGDSSEGIGRSEAQA